MYVRLSYVYKRREAPGATEVARKVTGGECGLSGAQ